MQIGNVGSIGGLDLSNMDIETAMMAVQSQRTQLLDTQLASQIKDVQGRNDAIAQLNSTLGDVDHHLARFASLAGFKNAA